MTFRDAVWRFLERYGKLVAFILFMGAFCAYFVANHRYWRQRLGPSPNAPDYIELIEGIPSDTSSSDLPVNDPYVQTVDDLQIPNLKHSRDAPDE
jgi:hypothetical protein